MAVLLVVFCVMTALLFVFPDLNAPERSDAIVVLGGHGAPAFDEGRRAGEGGLRAPIWCCRCRSGRAARPYGASALHSPRCTSVLQGQPRRRRRARPVRSRPFAKRLHWHRIIVVMPTTQATRARLRIGRCYSGQVLEVACSPGGIVGLAQFAYEWGAMFKARGAAAELLTRQPRPTPTRQPCAATPEATRSQPPATPVCDTRCTVLAGAPVSGDPARGGSSAGERPGRRDTSSADGRRRPCLRDRPAPHERTPRRRPRRLPQRAIELVGIALGIAFIAAVASGHQLSNDEFWSLAAGQWMLAHHRSWASTPSATRRPTAAG